MRLTIKTKLAATFVVIVALSGASMFIALQNLGQLNDTLELLGKDRTLERLNDAVSQLPISPIVEA